MRRVGAVVAEPDTTDLAANTVPQLKALAAERGVERTKIIRWALIDYLKKHGTFVSTNEPDERQVETVV